MRIPSGVTDQYIYFVAVDATDFTTRETGLSSFTVYRSRNGAAAAAMTTPTINETDGTNMPGVYELLLDEDMTIDSGDDSQEMVFHITHAGMAPVTRTIELYRPKITAGETLTVTSGLASANATQISGDTTAADNLEAVLDGTGGVNLKAAKVEFTNGLILTRSDSDSPAFSATGNGTGAGIYAYNGGGGYAVYFNSASGDGMFVYGGGGSGIKVQGDGSASDDAALSLYGLGGVGAPAGIYIRSEYGHGIDIKGSGNESPDGHGIYVRGGGNGSGIYAAGGLYGVGLNINGGATSGAGMTINSTTGDAVTIASAAGNGDAIQLTPHGTGYGINGTLSALGSAGAALSAIPWNAAWATEVQSECADALTAADVATQTLLTTVAGYLDTEIAAIKAKTDNLPASPASVGDIPTAGTISDAVADEAYEGSITLRQAIRVLLAAAAGKSADHESNAPKYRDQADTKNRISATSDSNGNRTAVTLDVS